MSRRNAFTRRWSTRSSIDMCITVSRPEMRPCRALRPRLVAHGWQPCASSNLRNACHTTKSLAQLVYSMRLGRRLMRGRR